jgi:alpha-D-xyloside xylohydrolase
MENGGRGEHRPWELGREVVATYRYYAKLHRQLVPYLYSAGVEAHRTGRPIIREPSRELRQYLLGEDILVAPVVTRDDKRTVSLPAGRWHDYWDDDEAIDGPKVLPDTVPRERMPLYIRAGAIIPMEIEDDTTGHGGRGSAGHLTLLIYPEGATSRRFNLDADRSITIGATREDDGGSVQVEPGAERYVLRIMDRRRPREVDLQQSSTQALAQVGTWEAFDRGPAGWYYDNARHYLWVRFAAEGSPSSIRYRTER